MSKENLLIKYIKSSEKIELLNDDSLSFFKKNLEWDDKLLLKYLKNFYVFNINTIKFIISQGTPDLEYTFVNYINKKFDQDLLDIFGDDLFKFYVFNVNEKFFTDILNEERYISFVKLCIKTNCNYGLLGVSLATVDDSLITEKVIQIIAPYLGKIKNSSGMFSKTLEKRIEEKRTHQYRSICEINVAITALENSKKFLELKLQKIEL